MILSPLSSGVGVRLSRLLLCVFSALDDQTESMRDAEEQHRRTREAEERLSRERDNTRLAQERVLSARRNEEEESKNNVRHRLTTECLTEGEESLRGLSFSSSGV